MSLRSRLAILFGLVALVASGLVGAISYRSTALELRDSTDRFLRARADETVENARDLVLDRSEPGVRGRPGAEGRVSDGLPVADDDSIIQISGPEGRGLSSSVELPVTAAAEDLRDSRSGSGTQVVYEDVAIDGESYRMASLAGAQGGLVQVARSTAENDEVLRALVGRFAVIAIVVAALAALIGWLLATTATAPLRRLTGVVTDVATTRDFTTDVGEAGRTDEIGQLAASFATMLDALEASRAQQHRLIHDAGHELRTPLTSLRANVAMLERAGDLPAAERAEILAAIRSELVELGDLFDEMIDLATDQRDGALERVPVDLAGVVDGVAARWAQRSDRPIELDVRSSTVQGDAAMLERAVSNLVSNADKFSPAGEPVTIVSSDGTVSVRDRGPGIAPDDRAHVFERFHRSESTRAMPGSGLGLSIVAQIVELHGGEVWVREAVGGGADVGFRLPTDVAPRDVG
ncbi:sensor histidine kinase [Ilumatobacter nonamiensis]|uniref:sensor histidine kinase n=1 Tax=Ilumatobacter nonamiensis TaxID=467093 RepID=UPI0003479DBF|nr:ATP-binding protein [Ilumatobacter nonamiensis]